MHERNTASASTSIFLIRPRLQLQLASAGPKNRTQYLSLYVACRVSKLTGAWLAGLLAACRSGQVTHREASPRTIQSMQSYGIGQEWLDKSK